MIVGGRQGRVAKKVVLWSLSAIGVLILLLALSGGPTLYRVLIGLKRFETVPPVLPFLPGETSILVFSKTNGFRDDAAVEASNIALAAIAQRNGWSIFETENGAVFNPQQLARFKAVVWNNTSGDVLTADQREAFKMYLEGGGGFVGIHGAGGDPHYAWSWYVNTLIGAQFIGHTLRPQFQQATVIIEDQKHPAMQGLGSRWVRTDEWYSFSHTPRAPGIRVLASLDERSYSPRMSLVILTKDLRMGDHPIIWLHCIGNGRALYSAMGHAASTYSEPKHIQMLEGAIGWAAGLKGTQCVRGSEVARSTSNTAVDEESPST